MQPGNLKYRLCCLVAGLCFSFDSRLVVWSQDGSPLAHQALPTVPLAQPTAATDTAATDTAALHTSQTIPIQRNASHPESLSVNARDHLVSIFAREVDLRIVLGHLAEESQVNIVIAENVDAKVTTTLNNVPLWDALDAVLRINGLVWTQKGEIIFVTRPGAGGGNGGQATSNNSPGLQLNVFELDYVSSTEVLEVVKGLLSPSGKAFMHAVDKTQNRQTRERIVIEDYPDRLETIGQYLHSVDNPPLQVLIEAHVLQVTLTDDQRHGVNLSGLLRLATGRVDVRAQGFANGANSPGFMVGLDSTDLDGMVEALCSKSNVRTLAAPKVLVVNGQEARIQIGSRFGYFLTTTTQTSSLQSVDFLDIGVVLQVTPTITQHGQVMLSVAPKVSGGRINPDSGLPEEDTTEANTTVLLPDGKGMIIGGLIKESDGQKTSWVPWLGKLPVLRHLFSRSSSDSTRVEVIIALTPHIVPYRADVHDREFAAFHAAANPAGVICASPMLPEYAGEPFDPKQPPLSQTPWDANGTPPPPTVPEMAFPMLPANGSQIASGQAQP